MPSPGQKAKATRNDTACKLSQAAGEKLPALPHLILVAMKGLRLQQLGNGVRDRLFYL